ncbi:MAG TPA: Fe-S cluster assembly protein SufD [Acidimicrobiales bacterium]|nr:Fe-S cluster assembly protein SufD [Acidimicrobiales bacterium]
MSSFTAEAVAALPGPAWLRNQREEAFGRFSVAERPTDAEDVWRYSRIGDLDLEAYEPVKLAPPSPDGAPPVLPAEIQAVLDDVGDRSGLAVLFNGQLVHCELAAAPATQGVHLGSLSALDDGAGLTGSVAGQADSYVELATAFMADAVVVRVPRGIVVEAPIVVVHWVDAEGAAVFPRLIVDAGEMSQFTVLDYATSAPGVTSLVFPVVELDVGDAANVSYLNIQQLGPKVWQVGYQASRVRCDATLSSTTIALGGDYARVRTDSRLAGRGGHSNLLAAYFGDAAQMHDFRTMQDHDAPKTTSDLLFKGAVEDEAHSVYSGLIRVRKGAGGTSAFQTNRNLVLTPGAQADSVPNLEIEENDVHCSHASAVGPVDEDQRYYLESRGVPSEVAERLIVLGFFDDIIDRSPIPALRRRLRAALAAKLPGVEA